MANFGKIGVLQKSRSGFCEERGMSCITLICDLPLPLGINVGLSILKTHDQKNYLYFIGLLQGKSWSQGGFIDGALK